jgi:PHD/YefM family antitoxin component YafN of YafNO toxin-antitoxin module
MITVPATEFSKNFGQYREIAQREPVAVTSHDRVTGYFVSSENYEEYRQFKLQRTREALHRDIQIGLDQAAKGEVISAQESKQKMAVFKEQFLTSRD